MFLNNSDILTDLGQFISNLFQDFTSGLLFFGGPLDIIVAVLDILATSLVVYYVLKILRDSRAWQLLKGLLLIVGFAVICSLAGLNTVGFLLNNTLSVLAIAFVVIFQPELRRALETVGRNSFNVISSAITQDEPERSAGSVHKLIESIVRACEKMAEAKTGALIILERQTKLGELVEQENVIQLDAAVSATMLLQIFYKGSPLHDGAVLIRDGRLTAARVHVPLSDNYHLRKDFGTRHRAAIGASEMGDAIAVVVSEERGCISLALEGRLYTLNNADALRTLLHKLLSPSRPAVSLSTLSSLFRSGKHQSRSGAVINENGSAGNDIISDAVTGDAVKLSALEPENEGVRLSRGLFRRKSVRQADRPRNPIPKKQRVLLLISSLAIAIILWLYVQVTINPVDSRSFTVQLEYRSIEIAQDKGFSMQIPLKDIQVTLQGRKNAIADLTDEDIEAYVDFSQVDAAGLVALPVEVDTSGLAYLRTTYISPAKVTINVWEKEATEK